MSMRIKSFAMDIAAIAAVWSACCAERITVDEVVSHYPWDGKVDCVYSVSGLEDGYDYKAAFTLTVKKSGEVIRRIVTNEMASVSGIYTNTFDCAVLFGAGQYPNGGIKVDLIRIDLSPADATGTHIGIVGDVLIVDVSGGSEAKSYPTRELTGVDLGAFNCDVYKTDKIVLRKVPAGSYYCQPGADYTYPDPDNDSKRATQMLSTRGFYIGVFPVTQRQYELVMGANPSSCQAEAAGNLAAQRPVETVSMTMIRGEVVSGISITASSPDSFMRRLVVKTGRSGFDLPTEAQWEMACRANSSAEYGAYWNGASAVELSEETVGEVAWYYTGDPDGPFDFTTHAVGGKRPNLWGLYDMQGNVLEFCRDGLHDGCDWNHTYDPSYVDTPFSDDGRLGPVVRGGSARHDALVCNPSDRYYGATYGDDGECLGFRVSITLDRVPLSEDPVGSPIGIKGDVLVIDVSAGCDATTYPTKEYADVDIGTFNCDVYKTERIVLRKIPAGTYYCEPGADESTTVSQKLTTKGFYIGVLPITQRQYELVMGVNPSSHKTDAWGDVAAQRPVEMVTWNMIRGNVAAGAAIVASSADSFMQRLVAKTGLSSIDLPTEAQWEMACRANVAAPYGAYWNGTAAVGLSAANIGEAAWCSGDALLNPHAVGCKRPNMWGLYDTIGNVSEMCRDVYNVAYNPVYVDAPCTETPSFALGGVVYVARGGSYYNDSYRPSERAYYYTEGESDRDSSRGFRLSMNLRSDPPATDATGMHIGIAGDVLVIDVSAGSEATSYPTYEYAGVDIGAFNCDVYKTDKIVLKKVPAGSYYCQPGAYSSTTVSQKLTTKGFYIGVFPVTQRQYERVMGSNPSYFTTDASGNAAAQRPVEYVSWNTIRGSVAAGTAIAASSADSFMKRLVAKTGLSGFDLPTEAQWEMACRAGSTAAYGSYWNGSVAVEMTSANIGDAAWSYDNSSSTTHAVGGKKPNLWGLYDTQGNVREWCRDIYISTYNIGYVDAPCADTSYYSGEYRVLRGGGWGGIAGDCRPSNRVNNGADAGSIDLGFRLSRALP